MCVAANAARDGSGKTDTYAVIIHHFSVTTAPNG